MRMTKAFPVIFFLTALGSTSVMAQKTAVQSIEEYRAMLPGRQPG